jgi:hypothetical protein
MQTVDIVTVDGQIRFQVTGACGEKKFELTFSQLIQYTSGLDLTTCDAREYRLVLEAAEGNLEVEWNKVDWLTGVGILSH